MGKLKSSNLRHQKGPDPEMKFQRILNRHRAGAIKEAANLYRKFLKEYPSHDDAWHLLGCTEFQSGNLIEARKHLDRALELNPQNVPAHNTSGLIWKHSGDARKAREHFQKALALRPGYADAANNLAVICMDLGLLEDAESLCREVLKTSPDFHLAHHNLALVLVRKRNYREGIETAKNALARDPGFMEAWHNLGNAWKAIGEPEEAVKSYRKTLDLAPLDPARVSDYLFALNYHPSLSAEEVAFEHRSRVKPFELERKENSTPHQPPNRSSRLRIGYVSPDFRRHPVAFFFEDLLRYHHRGRFEIFCYSNVANPDDMTKRFSQLADHWIPIRNLSDEEAADRILEDGIDILIDLAGHTEGNRLPLFLLRPAPLQVTYLGYPNTTGSEAFDFRISDAYCDPPGATEILHSERIARIPGAFFSFRPPEEAPEPGPPPVLENGYVTFGSFNNLAKISIGVLDVWAQILTRVDQGRLMMQAHALQDPWAEGRIVSFFAERGITRDRLEFIPPSSFFEHLRLHRQVDIALDTFPWNGHTTTCNTLWMGVPVVTLVGNRTAERMGYSILANLSLDPLVAASSDEYVEIAAYLAGEVDLIKNLRSELRQRFQASELTDSLGFARRFESVLQQVANSFSRT